jgi:hypothetical protein
VPVAVGEEHGAIRADPVQVLAAREAAREVGERPAAAGDPLRVRVRGRVFGDGLQVLVQAAPAVELAGDAGEAGRGRVNVGVPEPGCDRPAAKLDHARRRAHEGLHVPLVANGHDSAAAHGDGFGPGRRGIGGEDPAPGQDEVGGDIVPHGREDDSIGPQAAWRLRRTTTPRAAECRLVRL